MPFYHWLRPAPDDDVDQLTIKRRVAQKIKALRAALEGHIAAAPLPDDIWVAPVEAFDEGPRYRTIRHRRLIRRRMSASRHGTCASSTRRAMDTGPQRRRLTSPRSFRTST